MRLYLSSYQIGNAAGEFLDLIGNNKNAVVIANAADHFDDSRKANWVKRSQDQLASLGISSAELDLREYFSNNTDFPKILANVGLIWVTGGNTFILRRAMRQSGFDQILPALLQRDQIVYGGFSAGVCVLSPSLKGIHLCDQPERVPPNYQPEIVWDGLNIIDFYVIPHFRSNHPESEMMEDVFTYYENLNLKHYDLRDGEAIKVNGKDIRVIGTRHG